MLHFLESRWACLVLLVACWMVPAELPAAPPESNGGGRDEGVYEALVRGDRPVAWWRMTPAEDGKRVVNSATREEDRDLLAAVVAGSVRLKERGPGGEAFPLFEGNNL